MSVTALGPGLGSQTLPLWSWKGLRDAFIHKYLLNPYRVLGTGHIPKSLLS